jgi:histidinol-phosphatase (PHP family)
MVLYDMHIHSKFSFDSSMEMEDAAERAIAAGLSGIAFTDHLDVNYMPDGSDVYYYFGDYLKRVNEVRAQYEGRLDILSAVEVGLQPQVLDENIERLKGYEFDYKIGSTHLISRVDPYDGSYFKIEPEKHHAYKRYLRELIKNVALYHDYNTLGHFDYIIRYAKFDDNMMRYSDFRDEFDELIRLMISFGLAFEVNTRSYDKTEMDLEVLKRFKAAGGETVVIGSDAHRYNRIGLGFEKALEYIKACGFRYIAHFKEGRPVYDKIG